MWCEEREDDVKRVWCKERESEERLCCKQGGVGVV